MKFIVYSANLLKKISLLEGVISNNTTLPILNNILFDLDGDILKMTASDMETTMTLSLEVEGSGDSGRMAVPSKMLSDMMKAFPEQPLTFNFNKETYELDVTSEQGNYKMAFFNSEDYPNIPEVKEPKVVTIPSEIISKGIEKTLFATSNDDLRPVLQGVLMKLNEEGVTFVASDTHRLSKYSKKIGGVDGEAEFVIPKKPLRQLEKIFETEEENITLEYNDSNVRFLMGTTEIVCRLIEGSFPNYEVVIPKDNPYTLVANKSYMLKALKRVTIFSDRSTNQVRFKFEGSKLELTAEDIDYSNKAIENLTVGYEGDDLLIGFGGKFMMEVLSKLDTDDFSMGLSHPSKGGLIKQEGGLDEGEDLEILIMPVLIKQD